jgi:hypothetical protein
MESCDVVVNHADLILNLQVCSLTLTRSENTQMTQIDELPVDTIKNTHII